MEIALGLPKEKCDVFQEYLHAAIRKLTGSPFGPTGSAGYRSDGRYVITMSIFLPTESGAIAVQLVMPIEPDGSLKKVEFHPIADGIEDSKWNVHASNFITGVVTSAFSKQLNRYFIRSTFCKIGSDLDGEYWLPGFRFAPAMPENEQSYLIDAERYLYIDQEVEAIDQMHAGDIASERALHYSARLSLILDTGLYQPPHGMKWFIENTENEGLVSKLGHLGFKHPSFPDKMPEKGRERRLGKFNTSIFDDHQNSHGLLMCPKETRKILRGLENCKPDIREAFDSCARLYQISLTAGRGFPTIRLAYQVGSVESITQNVSGYKGFSDFIKKEFPIHDDSHDSFLERLYRAIRSAHFHGGSFPLGEFESKKISWGVGNKSDHDNFNTDRYASKLIRQSIIHWIAKEIIPKGENSSD
jgi:hypothetical protein